MRAIETSVKTGVHPITFEWLEANNVEILIRYISRGDQSKCVDAAELAKLLPKYTVGIVYELNGGDPKYGGLSKNMTAAKGTQDGAYALATLKALRVPSGTVVYFAIDIDVDKNEDVTQYVIPYLKAAKGALAGYYRMGIYGCGSSCTAGLKSAGCDKAWLANARDWTGYQAFLASGQAAIVQGTDNNNNYDPNDIKDEDWGGFNALDKLGTAV